MSKSRETLLAEASADLRALHKAHGPFDIITSDPPWRFKSNSQKNPGRNAMRHYDCMDLEDIKALPVKEIAAKDSLLLLWGTVPMMPQALEVAKAWGFTYKSNLAWIKDRTGTGFWNRNQHELLLICRRGKFPCRAPGEDAPLGASVIDAPILEAPVRQHSRKPDEFYERVEGVPQWADRTARLDMFCRESREGWVPFGNEASKFDPLKIIDDILDMTPEDPTAEELLS